MMKFTKTNGQCPHCKCTFNAKKATLTFPVNLSGKQISFAFALCPDCYQVFILADKKLKNEIIKTSFTNFKKNQHNDWTITSSLALVAHSGDFFNAWWYGLDIPKPIFDAINNRLINDVAFLRTWSLVSGVHYE